LKSRKNQDEVRKTKASEGKASSITPHTSRPKPQALVLGPGSWVPGKPNFPQITQIQIPQINADFLCVPLCYTSCSFVVNWKGLKFSGSLFFQHKGLKGFH